MHGPGTWRDQSILFDMIIYSVFLVIMSMIWIHRYYRGTKKPGKKRLIFLYLFSSWIINIILGHRGVIHSIWIPLALYIFIVPFSMWVALALSLGYLSHLVADSFTLDGVPFFWPFTKRVSGFIRTGSMLENIIFLGILAADVYLLFFVRALF